MVANIEDSRGNPSTGLLQGGLYIRTRWYAVPIYGLVTARELLIVVAVYSAVPFLECAFPQTLAYKLRFGRHNRPGTVFRSGSQI